MALRIDERATEVTEIDRFESGVGWIAHPDERMERASHAIERDGDLWLIDPVDADGLDGFLAEFGDVAGVIIMLDRHKRDAATIAIRHDVPVFLPRWFDGVASDLPPETGIVRFDHEVSDTGLRAHVVKDSRFWQEVALFDPEDGTLIVAESLGTAPYFRAGREPLGVHPMRRVAPPTDPLGDFDPERILVGHGHGILEDADEALENALTGAQKRIPLLGAQMARNLLPF